MKNALAAYHPIRFTTVWISDKLDSNRLSSLQVLEINNKNMDKKIFLAATILLVLILAGSGLVFWKYYDSSAGFAKNPKTLSVGAEIESKGVSATIAAKGGQLEVSDINNEKIILTFPEKSFFESETVSMRRINKLEAPYSQWKFISGVELTPDGTKLANAGELKIKIPKGTNTDDLAGFSFGAGGKDFYLYPIKIQNDTAIFKLSGFSGYGLINLGGYEPDTQPSDISKQAKQSIFKITKGAAVSKGSLSGIELKKVSNLLRAWWKTEVKTQLAQAKTNEALVDQAGYEFLDWLGVVQLFGLDGEFSKEIEDSLDSLAIAIRNGAEKSSKKCFDNKDALQTPVLLHMFAFTEMAGINGRQELDAEKIKKMARNCANFELRITSIFEDSMDKYTDIGKYSGTIPLTVDEGFFVSGEGTVKIESYREMVGSEFEHGCTANKEIAYPVSVHDTELKVAGNQPGVSLTFGIGDPGDIKHDCSYYIKESLFKITGSIIGPQWDLDFSEFHEDEEIKMTNEEFLYLLPDWEIVNRDGIFARKVYQRSKNSTSLLGGSSVEKEDTKFELVHMPKR